MIMLPGTNKIATTPVTSEKQTVQEPSLNKEKNLEIEYQASNNAVDPNSSKNSGEANSSVALKIIETFIAKNPEDKSPSFSVEPTPKKVGLSNDNLVLPEASPTRNSLETPLNENTLVVKNNVKDLETPNQSIEFHFKDILAKDLTQESIFEAFLPDTKSVETIAPKENSLAVPFQNHPHYSAGKKFNLEGETIGWDSCSDEENPNSLLITSEKPLKPNSSLNNEKEISRPVSSRVSPVIDRKKRKKISTGKTKTRFPWQPEELAALEEGMLSHGTKWSMILADHGPSGKLDQRLASRSQIQLKDKARTERQSRERAGRPIGIFNLACKHA